MKGKIWQYRGSFVLLQHRTISPGTHCLYNMLLINDTFDALTAEDVERIVATFPLWRQTYTQRLKHFRNRRESAAAFALLQRGLQEHYGIEDFEFAYSEGGKPSLAGHPEIHFNISHCSAAAACAISRHAVGVDVERLGRYSERLARYTMNDDELAAILAASADDGERDLLFTRLWTQKEAVAKLTGEGISTNVRQLLQHPSTYRLTTSVNKEKGYVVTMASFQP